MLPDRHPALVIQSNYSAIMTDEELFNGNKNSLYITVFMWKRTYYSIVCGSLSLYASLQLCKPVLLKPVESIKKLLVKDQCVKVPVKRTGAWSIWEHDMLPTREKSDKQPLVIWCIIIRHHPLGDRKVRKKTLSCRRANSFVKSEQIVIMPLWKLRTLLTDLWHLAIHLSYSNASLRFLIISPGSH